MIFLTVGSQMPFDRLIRAVNQWVDSRQISEPIVAQVGRSSITGGHMTLCAQFSPSEFNWHCKNARFIIAHAGMGSILTALEHGKPIVVMPRNGSLQETRNDHQRDAARWLKTIDGVYFADDEQVLGDELDKASKRANQPRAIGSEAGADLLQGLRKFVNQPTNGN